MSGVPNRSQRYVHRKTTTIGKNRARTIGGAAISLALLSLYLFGTTALWVIGLAALVAVIALRRLRLVRKPQPPQPQAQVAAPRRRGRARGGIPDPLPPIGRRRKAASEELNTLSREKPVAAAPARATASPHSAGVLVIPILTPVEQPKAWPELPPPHYPNARPLLAGHVARATRAPQVAAPQVVEPQVVEPQVVEPQVVEPQVEPVVLPPLAEAVAPTPPEDDMPLLVTTVLVTPPQVLITPPPLPTPALPAPVQLLALPAPVWALALPAPMEEAPVEEAPVEETLVEETLVEEAPVEEAPVEETLVEETLVEETPVEETLVEETPVEETPVEEPLAEAAEASVVAAPPAPRIATPPPAPPLAPIVAVKIIRAPAPVPAPASVATPASVPPQAAVPPAPAPQPAPPIATPPSPYQLPSATMLPVPERVAAATDDEHLERAMLLEHTLKTFGVEARVVDFSPGPAVTRYELQPAPGVRVNKFTQLADDIALALAAQDIRIEAPIPGKAAVGIEVPNKERQMVPLREVLETHQFQDTPTKLAIALGKDNAGEPVIGDLARMPHLLIAGSTGSGKSVCMNTLICSLLFKAKPDEVKMLMIDPKMVELSIYNGIPHLVAPVITDVRKAAGYLKGAVKEMEMRYELFAAAAVRNIQQYNRLVAADPGPDPEHPRQPLPYIVIFIDELADLMMVAPADVEDAICRLAQMARACGMHLVIATQSPRVDVITGLIKANVPSRIAFAVSSQVDSRVIMDAAGAERLLGRGDMLYHPGGQPKPVRAQGAFIDEGSVEELVRFVAAQGKPTFTAQEVAVEVEPKRGGKNSDDAPSSAADAAFPRAVRVVIEHGQASVSILQRRLRCNYNKAVRLIDMMEERGFVGPHQGSRPREVLISLAQWQEEFSTDEDGEELSADD